MLFAAVLFGPLEREFVGAASMLGDPRAHRLTRSRPNATSQAGSTSTRFMGGVAVGISAVKTLTLVGSGFGGLIAATLVAAVGETLDVLFAAITSKVRGRPMRDAFESVTPLALLSAPVYAPVIAVLALAYQEVSPWTLAPSSSPYWRRSVWYGLYQEQPRLAVDLSVANETLERANLQFAGTLIATLDARDRYTAGHSAAVAIYSRDIASRMGLSV